MRTVFQILILILSSTIVVGNSFAQDKQDSIIIKGTVVDENNEPVFNAVVRAIQAGVLKAGVVTDMDGKFHIKTPIISGLILHVAYIGYNEHQLNILNKDIVGLTIKLEPNAGFADEVIVSDCQRTYRNKSEPDSFDFTTVTIPMFNKYAGGNTKTITTEEIEKGAY